LKGESSEPASDVDGVPPTDHKKSFMKPGMIGASRIVLRSFTGKIRLKRPSGFTVFPLCSWTALKVM